jgi:kinesin family protein 20
MIVNVNPYDTGFDENSHVMRFSALARDVATTTQRILPPRPPPAAKSSGMATGRMGQGLSASIGPGGTLATKDGRGSLGAAPTRTARKVRLSEGTPAETVLEVVEGRRISHLPFCNYLTEMSGPEDETYDDEDEEDIPRDTLVDELFEEVEYLRERVSPVFFCLCDERANAGAAIRSRDAG